MNDGNATGGGHGHARVAPASSRTAALDPEEIQRLLEERRFSFFLEEHFAPPEYQYVYVLSPAELCDIADKLGNEAFIAWAVEKPGRLEAQSDVIVKFGAKSDPRIGPTVVGLYSFVSPQTATRVWTMEQVYPDSLSDESLERMLDIRGSVAVNFQSGSYAYSPGEMEQVTSSQLWERICAQCDSLGIAL